MRANMLIGWASAIGLGLLTIYFASSVYFCAGSLKGEIGGCAAMAGESVLRSTTAQIVAVACVAGLVYAQRRGRRQTRGSRPAKTSSWRRQIAGHNSAARGSSIAKTSLSLRT